ncbi:MAG: PRC-barrel domain-containing protein [Candidatus Micrarchaeota archaeon]|nr:PRC-barrel domain-containing protein [Candidatus Micrarchaeota archaeon]
MVDTLLLSELYGKQIISNTGSILGSVEDIVVDFDEGRIASMLLMRSEQLIRSDHTTRDFAKNSVRYERVKSVAETIIVGAEQQQKK